MRKVSVAMTLGLTLLVAACGPNTATRATTGAATGAVVGGPVARSTQVQPQVFQR